MPFPLNSNHEQYAHFLDEMPGKKTDEEASWRRRQKIKLRLISGSIIVTFAVMVYVAMLLLSSSTSASESTSSSTSESGASIDIETSAKTPTVLPTELSIVPSSSPSEIPSDNPSQTPSNIPSINPTSRPSIANFLNPSPQPTRDPTPFPTNRRTKPPTKPPTNKPTKPPTRKPTRNPTPLPTNGPTNGRSSTTRQPSEAPSPPPSIEEEVATIKETATPSDPPAPTESELLETSFLVIGDIPYNIEEEAILRNHMKEVPDDMEFLIHVGDIRNGADRTDCTLEEFQNVADILLKSPIPVFIVPGDNEYNDCPNFEESFENWMTVFGTFEENWNVPFLVTRDRQRPENFYFIYKKVLYIGLNIVGGDNTDINEWETRLEHNFQWTKMLVDTFVVQPGALSVVIIGHADPRKNAHGTFFDPLKAYMEDELNNEIPFFYMNGDRHYFQFDEWMPNFHRIMVEGSRKEPPLRVSLTIPRHPKRDPLRIEDIYDYERYPTERKHHRKI